MSIETWIICICLIVIAIAIAVAATSLTPDQPPPIIPMDIPTPTPQPTEKMENATPTKIIWAAENTVENVTETQVRVILSPPSDWQPITVPSEVNVEDQETTNFTTTYLLRFPDNVLDEIVVKFINNKKDSVFKVVYKPKNEMNKPFNPTVNVTVPHKNTDVSFVAANTWSNTTSAFNESLITPINL
jgi:hypothetical protein